MVKTRKIEVINQKTNSLSIAGFILSFIVPLLGLIFSIISLNQIKSNKEEKGKGLAVAGLIISIIGCIFWIAIFASLGSHINNVTSPIKNNSNQGTPQTEPQTLELNMGETARTSTLEVTVSNARTTRILKESSSEMFGHTYEYDTTADDGKTFVIFETEVKNVGDGQGYISCIPFHMVDGYGYAYDYSSDTYLLDDALQGTTLYPNQREKGECAFEVPETASGLKIQYNFGFFDVKLAEWQV